MIRGDKMGIKIELPEQKEQEFREKAMRKFGYQKGALKKAILEAINFWILQEKGREEKVAHPTETLTGVLKGIQESSVELQHKATKLFIAR